MNKIKRLVESLLSIESFILFSVEAVTNVHKGFSREATIELEERESRMHVGEGVNGNSYRTARSHEHRCGHEHGLSACVSDNHE